MKWDPLKACFYLLGLVVLAQVGIATAAALSCIIVPWADLAKTNCDSPTFRADLMTSFSNAIAAVMSFAMASRDGPPKP